jgi:hypothetical protein
MYLHRYVAIDMLIFPCFLSTREDWFWGKVSMLETNGYIDHVSKYIGTKVQIALSHQMRLNWTRHKKQHTEITERPVAA